jgi:hypothetical protein
MNTNKIAKLLQMTVSEMNQVHASTYIKWCSQYAKELDYNEQSLIANTAVNKWFNQEWEALEKEAYETLSHVPRTALKARSMYGLITSDIYKNFPKTLFEAAKNLSIINEPLDYTRN